MYSGTHVRLPSTDLRGGHCPHHKVRYLLKTHRMEVERGQKVERGPGRSTASDGKPRASQTSSLSSVNQGLVRVVPGRGTGWWNGPNHPSSFYILLFYKKEVPLGPSLTMQVSSLDIALCAVLVAISTRSRACPKGAPWGPRHVWQVTQGLMVAGQLS